MDESAPSWMLPDPESTAQRPVNLQTDRPHSARVYNYIIGGKDNFGPDREAGDALLTTLPTMGILHAAKPRVDAPGGRLVGR